jgi:hypothetical protein
MGHEVVLGVLDERVAACRSESERLRAESERINSLLQLCESELERLTCAREVVAGPPAAAAAAVVVPPQRGVEESRPGHEVFAARLLAVLAVQKGPVRCRVLVEVLGLEACDRHVERA